MWVIKRKEKKHFGLVKHFSLKFNFNPDVCKQTDLFYFSWTSLFALILYNGSPFFCLIWPNMSGTSVDMQ